MVDLKDLHTVKAPSKGVFRIGRGPDPLQLPDPPPNVNELDDPEVGNRFDSALGEFGVLYFGTQLECCFAETLARFRPDPEVIAAISDDWPDGFMELGAVPKDWRTKRLIVQAEFPKPAVFLDVEHETTREALRSELADVLALYGAKDLDVATVRGPDRRITRAISQWVWEFAQAEMAPIAGIRYESRLKSQWEAWAVFETTPIAETSRTPITLDQPALKDVVRLYNLVVH